ncbi:MAG TPA: glycosyltransferase family 39 protein [Terriglobales bacterium]|nr:glycosyltransferase family 39 protein [Terriglobales bacterium]
MSSRARTDWLLLAGFCAFLFFFGLNYFGFIGADEPRYAQVAREMLARHDWITPILGGKPWLEKPPLFYWQSMIVFSVAGVHDWAARLPSAFDATLMVIAVYWFFCRLRPGFELDAALITASCAAVVGFARAASTDMPLAATFTITLLAWYAWHEIGRNLYLLVSYAFLAFAMLAKGPVAPFLALLIVGIFALAKGDARILLRSFWIPGLVLFFVLALPWFFAVQLRNPEFLRVFILQHNLERFGTNLYHHSQPFWYYLPVTILAMVPWVVFVIAAVAELVRSWWSKGASLLQSADALNVFLLIWLAIPVIFFSLSQSKLPGYILPAIPAGAMMLAEYIRRHVVDDEEPPAWLLVLHSTLAALPLIPALMLWYIVLQHRFPWGTGTFIACSAALIVAVAMAITLLRPSGLRLLRFVTLIPVVLSVAAILKIGAPALDMALSARPLALEISQMETKPLPMAVFKVRREVEYGLAFYRNQVLSHYDLGQIPPVEHLLVAPEGSEEQVKKLVADRRVSHLGAFTPQHIDYFWVSAAGTMPGMQMPGMQMPGMH